MLFLHTKSLHDYIIELLKDGPIGTLEMVRQIQKIRPKTSKQGIYAALRILNKEEVVVLSKGVASLSMNWLKQLSRFTQQAQEKYWPDDISTQYFMNLSEGDSISYNFKSPVLLDSFWSHALIALMQVTPASDNCFIYDPHYWFIYTRPGSELPWLKTFKENKRYLLLAVGYKQPLDKQVGKLLEYEYVQYSMLDKLMFEKENYYVSVMGDFIIEGILDLEVEKKIRKFYKVNNEMNETLLNQLKEITAQDGKNKLKISRNSKKADRIKKKLKKYFYIPVIKD